MQERQDENWKREVKDGAITYIHYRTGKVLRIATNEQYRARLIKLLDEAGGDLSSKVVEDFWRLRNLDIKSNEFDGMLAAWALEVYEIMFPIWEEFERREDDGDDLFSAFGL